MMLLLFFPQQGRSGARPADDKKNLPTAKLRIEVTGGDDNKPVAQASVYVKFAENPNSHKSKDIEFNLKSNQEGVTQSPAIPQGKVLIQIVAQGWKTYGEWYDISQPEQTIRIHLEHTATNWY